MAARSSEVADWDPIFATIKGMHVWRDMMCLPCMPADIMADMLDNFRFQAGDVLMLSYPQSCFFWAQEVIYHLHNLDTLDVPLDQKDTLVNRFPFLEHEFKNVSPKDIIAKLKTPRLIKSHLGPEYLEKCLEGVEDKVKYIMWTLEPKDVVVNYCDYWNIKGVYFKFPKLEWDYFYEIYKRKSLFEGDWCDMNVGWAKKLGGGDNLLVLPYEAASKDKHGCVRSIAKFLDIQVTDEQVDKIVNIKEFDKWPQWSRMMSQEQKEYVDKETRERVAGTILEEHYPSDKPV